MASQGRGMEAGGGVRLRAARRASRARAWALARLSISWAGLRGRLAAAAREEEGQGTTEYAILVGVIVVIAIAAIALFRGRLQTLWDSIASAINGL